VNSTARAPVEVIPASVHFADGGYYDNDGTASALEFVRSALDGQIAAGEPSGTVSCDALPVPAEKSPAGAAQKTSPPASGANHCLHILWIEIRNSGDIGMETPTPGGNGGSAGPWKIANQLSAPLLAFWEAGHESTTLRNRNILTVFEKAYADRVSIQRVVFTDSGSGSDPLNWSLTPAQRKEVRTSACSASEQPYYQYALDIFRHWNVPVPPPVNAVNNQAPFCSVPGAQ
jgi:hypothetical protein